MKFSCTRQYEYRDMKSRVSLNSFKNRDRKVASEMVIPRYRIGNTMMLSTGLPTFARLGRGNPCAAPHISYVKSAILHCDTSEIWGEVAGHAVLP